MPEKQDTAYVHEIDGQKFELQPIGKAGASTIKKLKLLYEISEAAEKAVTDDPQRGIDAVEALCDLAYALLPRSQRALWLDLDPSLEEIQAAFDGWTEHNKVDSGK